MSDPSAVDGWYLDDLATRQPLVNEPTGRALTRGPLAGRLVQLVDTEGATLSNRVVVDDPQALSAALTANANRPGSDRPPELLAGDLDTRLAQALVWLHRNLVMDVSERTTSAPTGGVGADEANDQSDDDLWERLEKEKLARDTRASTYTRMWQRDAIGGTEPIIGLLEALRARTPSELTAAGPGRSVLTHLLDDREDHAEKPEKPARRWKVATRIRVRARNVLRRWAAAQTDPRLVWVDPLAPAGNFAMIAATLPISAWTGCSTLRMLNLQTAISTTSGCDGSAPSPGPARETVGSTNWIRRRHARSRSTARLAARGPAALCWLAVRPGPNQRERMITFQAVLAAARHYDLVEPTDATARYLSVVKGRPSHVRRSTTGC